MILGTRGPNSSGQELQQECREGGVRACFLLTLQVAKEALRVEFIIDEESGYASALSGQGAGAPWCGLRLVTGLKPCPALMPAPLSLMWHSQVGGKTAGAAPRSRGRTVQISSVACSGKPELASRPLQEPSLSKTPCPSRLTRLGHRRSLSSVSLRAIAYSLTSSDTPTI